MRSVIRFALFVTAAGLAATPAWAQLAPGEAQVLNMPNARKSKQQAPALPPPPAIPGAQSTPGSAAPAKQPASDLSPNAALFDAINRGDIAAARDALNRGADLSAQNVLGMTPIDLSIDLGRNDITFLLLSMRSGPDQEGSAVAAAAPKPPPTPPREVRRSRRPVTVVAAQATFHAPAPPRTAPLYAHDGGTPVPQAGFLGFDPGSAPR